MRTDNVLHIGAQIDIPMEDGTVRRCEVCMIDEQGFQVKYYTPEGVGPFFAALPHIELPTNTVHRTMYQNEAAGQHASFWSTHPDFKN